MAMLDPKSDAPLGHAEVAGDLIDAKKRLFRQSVGVGWLKCMHRWSGSGRICLLIFIFLGIDWILPFCVFSHLNLLFQLPVAHRIYGLGGVYSSFDIIVRVFIELKPDRFLKCSGKLIGLNGFCCLMYFF